MSPEPPELLALVLTDGPTVSALETVRSARSVAAGVVVVDTSGRPWPTMADGVAVAPVDWRAPGMLATIVERMSGRWVLVLHAGEAVRVVDAVTFAGALHGGPQLGVDRLGRSRARLLRAGEASVAELDHPAPPSGLAVERPGAGESTSTPGERTPETARLKQALPAGMRRLGTLADALEGTDLAAVETLQSHLDAVEERRLLEMARGDRDVCWLEPDHEDEPLVTIRIATYHRPELIGQAIESCLRQTYERLEIFVAGDHCSEENAAVVRSFSDPRIRFINLPTRGMYPSDLMARWRVAGSHPCNTVLALAEGSWITACDDDDEFTDDHVEVLLRHAKEHRCEMVYSRALVEVEPDEFVDVGSVPLENGKVAQGAVLYSLGLRFLKFSNTCWRNEMPADFHMWSRMERAGVRIGFLDRITYLNRLQTHRRAKLGVPTY